MANHHVENPVDESPTPTVRRQSPLSFTELPARTTEALKDFMKGTSDAVERKIASFRNVPRRPGDADGSVETLGGTAFTHHFIDTPGDGRLVRYHYVESGPADGEPVLLLHGIPASWYQWWHVMAALPSRFRAIAIDLKGYGQSDKRTGDYTYAGTADELLRVLDALGVRRFSIVAHDRGVLPADHITAKHPFRVLRYVRGEQQLTHYNPALSPQEHIFARSEPMRDATKLVVMTYQASPKVSDADFVRTIQEFQYEGIADAVPRYFNASSFTAEWIERRTKLMSGWRAPIRLIQGRHSDAQPHEFYEDAAHYIPNADSVDLRLIDAGHFWPLENPSEASALINDFLTSTPAFDADGWAASLRS